jgi:predicted short-subunit dehydrogenase-like oxidoreductase (DUF2520 family)
MVKIARHVMLTQGTGVGSTWSPQKKMAETISIVGAGRVGKALGRRLHELGWRVGVVTTRSIPTARAAVRVIGAGHPSDRLTRQVLASDVVLIAAPDRAIEGVAAELAHLGGSEWRGKVVLHTSGALDASVLETLAAAGAATGSMHPLQTFGSQGVPNLSGRVFGIDGNPAALNAARKMIRQMGGVAVRLSGGNKAAYHAAGSFACAHVLALLETATRLLMAQGFKRKQATRALLGLTRQTLDNLEGIGPRASWTGALTRGDLSTVQRHVDALSRFPAEYQDAYKANSRLTAAVLSDDPTAMLQKLDGIFQSREKSVGGKRPRKKSAAG